MAHLLEHMDAVVHGLSVMSSQVLVNQLPRMIEELLGVREGSVIVARLLEMGAREGFQTFIKTLNVDPSQFSLEELLGIFVRQEGQPPRHPFQVFGSVECSNDKCILETRECYYLDTVRKHPAAKAVFIGVVAGVLEAAGYHVRWLVNTAAKKYLCGNGKPDIVIYVDEEIELPACRLVVEKYSCKKKA
ncbi:hypothetical protein Pyrde_0189 [Pyrodictium delaneyi]|uniref:Uncharacterized protein n=1 Tax=Pyrodictium delaneyi TaxID=1273541 RepID=A0A0P0N1H6_9CREN|nr:hypothetical protein [Pyrodictium delaneyi]ALL00239.1 hypothetical protein Pyrde_0189 [Pyrodictium delaneyi]OWJ54321.1 hypothetical protein Pdsh_07500 [Pyrodictium delaneyi]